MSNPQRVASTETLESGPCPNCEDRDGRTAGCGNCESIGSILFSPRFTARDDMRLRSYLEGGRSLRYTSVVLDKPMSLVEERARKLGLPVRRRM